MQRTNISILTPLQQRIRAAAIASGRSLDELADHVSFSSATLRSLGNADRPTISPERLLEIERVTGAPAEWLEAGWSAVIARSHLPKDLGEPAEEMAELLALARDLSRKQEEAESRDAERERTIARLDERLRALERGGGPPRRAGRSPRT